MTRKPILRRIALVLAALPAMAFAASGEFTFVTGEVTLEKAGGAKSVPVRGTAVDPGDRISTGASGMVQITMVDKARISLRPSTQFLVERYGDREDSATGAVLNLLRGTLRTFTGLISQGNRDKFVMKTRVATVGIRGSGNILYACEGAECDPSVAGEGRNEGAIAVNHTIEGSHAVSNIVPGAPEGTPAQQGGTATLITGPGQTVLVLGSQPPRYIPTPRFIADAATTMVAAKATEAAAPAGAGGETRNFSPSDTQALPASVRVATPIVGNNGLGFPTIDATGNLAADPLDLRDITVAAGGTFSGQALGGDLLLNNGQLRGYQSYAGTGSTAAPAFSGTLRESQTITVDGTLISLGRYENASLGFAGQGSVTPIPGNLHFVYANSAYPPYLSDVLTGNATYTLVAATAPTNQNNVAGALGSAQLDVNFSQRTLNLAATVSIPASGGASGGNWQLNAQGVPIALNAFFASSNDRLIVVNGGGQSSRTNGNLSGAIEGSFVGTGLSGAILG